jgi:hypothetical protein
MLGRALGSERKSLVMRLRAGVEILEGMWYSFFLMREYVSFKQEVSKGGLPTRSVYLHAQKSHFKIVLEDQELEEKKKQTTVGIVDQSRVNAGQQDQQKKK